MRCPSGLTRIPGRLTRVPSLLLRLPSRPKRCPSRLTRLPSRMTRRPSRLLRVPSRLTRFPSRPKRLPSRLTRCPSRLLRRPSGLTRVPSRPKRIPRATGARRPLNVPIGGAFLGEAGREHVLTIDRTAARLTKRCVTVKRVTPCDPFGAWSEAWVHRCGGLNRRSRRTQKLIHARLRNLFLLKQSTVVKYRFRGLSLAELQAIQVQVGRACSDCY